jgi:hypothetical protein
MPTLLFLALLAAPLACAGPYKGPKTLAAASAALLVGGGSAWAVGDRTSRTGLSRAGLVSSAVGLAGAMAAGGWLALQAGCQGDFQCPEGEACREIPAPPGTTPYRQCMRR